MMETKLLQLAIGPSARVYYGIYVLFAGLVSVIRAMHSRIIYYIQHRPYGTRLGFVLLVKMQASRV